MLEIYGMMFLQRWKCQKYWIAGTKWKYMLVMEKVLPDFSDEDNMKFVRVTNMFNKNMNVKYPELLNLIYYNEKSDNFTHLLELMKNTLTDMHNILFEQLERLNDDDLNEEQLDKELRRSEGMTKVAEQIIRNGELAYKTMVHMAEYGYADSKGSVPEMLEVRD